jgi:hypothetical protein
MKAVIADLARQGELEIGVVAEQAVQPGARQLHDEKVVRGIPHGVVDHAFQLFRCLRVARRVNARGRQVRRVHGSDAVEEGFLQRAGVAHGGNVEIGLGHGDGLVAEGCSDGYASRLRRVGVARQRPSSLHRTLRRQTKRCA